MTDRNTGELVGGKSCLRKAIILIESCLFILKEGIFFAILQEMTLLFPFISKNNLNCDEVLFIFMVDYTQ